MIKPDPRRIAHFIDDFRVEPGRRVRLPKDFDPTETTRNVSKSEAKQILERGVDWLAEYQSRLAAQDDYGLLVILQAMDAAGKDGTIRHVMSGVNPQGVEVHSFKVPSGEELDHDYLWRYQKRLPQRGHIGIFNRSHYEEVLVVRVHPQILEGQKIPRKLKGRGIWDRRFREINDWERYLTDQGYRIVKLFLNVSKEEQKERFLARIDEPDRNWKFSAADVRERRFWDDYQKAFSEVLSNTSTEWAPWYVIPADDKPFARVAAGAVILDALLKIDPRYPTVSEEAKADLQVAKVELLGGAGAAAEPSATAEPSAAPETDGASGDPARDDSAAPGRARKKDRKRKKG